MKLRFGFAMTLAATALLGACDKKAETPAEPAKVESGLAPAENTAAPTNTAPAPTEAKVAATPSEAKAGEPAGGVDEHAGCNGMKADDENCPFPDNKAAGGCGAHAATAEPTKTATGVHFGTAFALTEAKPLGQAIGSAADGQELNVRVSGKIEKVCQKMGCWMVVKDGDVEARVAMKDHAFTVPVDSTGKAAQVEGTLKVRVLSEAQVKHLAEDAGEDPNTVKGERREFHLTATAIEIDG